MKKALGWLLRRTAGKTIAFAAAIAMMPPVSACVLCVAPGSHIAIEEFNSGCCQSSKLTAQSRCLPNGCLDPAEDCGNCTDFLLSTEEGGRIPESTGNTANAPAAECFGIFRLWIPSGSILPHGALYGLAALRSTSASLPLRC